MRIRGNRQGRGEGRQEKHSFPKCRLSKGNAETQAIIFIKRQKKTLNSPAAGVY